ncbi:hypothetical protein ACWEO2_12610 [Nocardia sp. NPDC004278]
MMLALTWSWAPIRIAVVFVVTAIGHLVTKAIAEAAVAPTRIGMRWIRGGRSVIRPTPRNASNCAQ